MERLLALLILTLLASPAQAQTAQLRQQQVYEGDIVELSIEYETSMPSLYAIDTAPLENDFELLDTRAQISSIQGQEAIRHRMQWSARMVPRHSGRLRVPPLRFGDDYSNPLWLDVISPDSQLRARQKIFVEIEARPENPYPGQQTRVTMRLLHNLDTLEGGLREPEISAQAEVYRSGRDDHYRARRDGDSLSVVERSILLIPTTTDRLRVPAASFRGHFNTRGDSGDDSGSSRYIYRESRELQLQLRPLPPGIDTDAWLPARRLHLQLTRDRLDAPITVGESVGVTLLLQADGLPGEALPAGLLLREGEAYRIYADQAVHTTRVEGSARDARLLGRLQQRYVIIPEQPGELTLPALQLDWWDVEHDSARVALLEPTQLQVTGAAPGTVTPADSAAGAGTDRPQDLLLAFLYRHWPWIAWLLGALLGVGLVYAAKPQRRRIGALLAGARRRRRSLARLRRACRANNALAAHAALLDWARIHWRDHRICGLQAIALRTGTEAWRQQLQRLDAAVFAAGSCNWHGQHLWRLVSMQGRAEKQGCAAHRQRLPGLYPQQN